MTADNPGVPEDDDPFAYLYRADGAPADVDAATAPLPQQQPGVPRTSYQQATQVGRTQYGQRAAYPGAGQQQAAPPQYGYAQPQPQQQAQPPVPPQAGSRAANRGGGGNRGVVLGVVAVVVAIAIGIGFALFNSKDHSGDTAGSTAGSTSQASTAASGSPSDGSSASASPSAQLPGIADAATMTLAGTQASTQYPGAKAAGGASVPLTAPGQSISWTVTVPADGRYNLHVRYDNAAADAQGTITAGSETGKVNLKNYSGQQGDWTKGWVHSYGGINLKAGQNTIVLTLAAPGQPGVYIDQLALSTDTANPWG
ncbi:carbohydrate-binding protein [Streptacidiphilus monticola]|jgi:hypothetical protein|uniref:Carbohydrate-binding protein n=1 Tax=Streptacidiphilus monticola TaxID=2161674 RepID=A0ABW1G3Q2_9ACTN